MRDVSDLFVHSSSRPQAKRDRSLGKIQGCRDGPARVLNRIKVCLKGLTRRGGCARQTACGDQTVGRTAVAGAFASRTASPNACRRPAQLPSTTSLVVKAPLSSGARPVGGGRATRAHHGQHGHVRKHRAAIVDKAAHRTGEPGDPDRRDQHDHIESVRDGTLVAKRGSAAEHRVEHATPSPACTGSRPPLEHFGHRPALLRAKKCASRRAVPSTNRRSPVPCSSTSPWKECTDSRNAVKVGA
jgi:hypothetical protein